MRTRNTIFAVLDGILKRINFIIEKKRISKSNCILTDKQLYSPIQEGAIKDNLKNGYIEMSNTLLNLTNDMYDLEEEALEYLGNERVKW